MSRYAIARELCDKYLVKKHLKVKKGVMKQVKTMWKALVEKKGTADRFRSGRLIKRTFDGVQKFARETKQVVARG